MLNGNLRIVIMTVLVIILATILALVAIFVAYRGDSEAQRSILLAGIVVAFVGPSIVSLLNLAQTKQATDVIVPKLDNVSNKADRTETGLAADRAGTTPATKAD